MSDRVSAPEALTCQAAMRAASDELVGVLPDDERRALVAHIAACSSCACAVRQLRATLAVLASRPERRVPDSLYAVLASSGGGQAAALADHLPYLYSLANALDPEVADDLVQDTLVEALVEALANGEAAVTRPGLAASLVRRAEAPPPALESPAAPTRGIDPDADEPEVFYPDFYVDGPDAGAWIDSPVAWGEARLLPPEDGVLATETYAIVDAAVGSLDPVERALVTLVDVDREPLRRVARELDLGLEEARGRLADGRLEVRAALDRHVRS